MSKTVKEWLSELPEGIREKALINTDGYVAILKVESLTQALSAAFDWQKSKEGFDYWNSVYDKIIDGTIND